MTFADRVKQEYPEVYDYFMINSCPSDFGYEKEYNCVNIKCEECWKREMESENKSYWQNVCKIHEEQTKKGLRKYHMPIEENMDMDIEKRLVMLQEELVDGLMYIEHIKAWLKAKNDDGK